MPATIPGSSPGTGITGESDSISSERTREAMAVLYADHYMVIVRSAHGEPV
jgi:hypothetical protein